MNKLAIGALSAVALAAASGLGASYYLGGHIQQTLEHTAQTWSTEDGFAIRILQYERGIVRSQATSLWSLTNGEDTYDVTVTHDILHGPWALGQAARINTRFHLAKDSEPGLLQALDHRAPLEWLSTTRWDGSTTHTLHSPHFSTRFEDGSALTWGGLEAAWTLSAEHNAAKGWIRMPLLRLQADEQPLLTVEDSRLEFDSRIPANHGFWDGPIQLQLGRLMVHEPESGNQWQLQKLQLHGNTLVQEPLAHLQLDTHLAQLDMGTYRLNNVALTSQWRNIDTDWLDAFMAWGQSDDEDEEQAIALWRSLPLLLSGKPELAINQASMDTPDGLAQLSARLTYIGTNPEAFDPASDLEGSAQAQIPKSVLINLLDAKVRSDYLALLEQLGNELDETALQAAVDDGISKRLKGLLELQAIESNGDHFSAALEFSPQGLKLNGHVVELQQLLQLGGAI